VILAMLYIQTMLNHYIQTMLNHYIQTMLNHYIQTMLNRSSYATLAARHLPAGTVTVTVVIAMPL
jgi:hypothetical protein